jgi:hypothetical protein
MPIEIAMNMGAVRMTRGDPKPPKERTRADCIKV